MKDSFNMTMNVDLIPLKHGHWIKNNRDRYEYECSVCHRKIWGLFVTDEFNYCPFCGARMDAKEKTNEIN